jgi:biopolymer transport protein TolQ
VNEIASAAAGAGGHFRGSLLAMILDAGLIVQFVLLLLLVFSIISWTIIFMKWRTLKRVGQQNALFQDAYLKITKLSNVLPMARQHPASTLAEVFRAGYAELQKLSHAIRESKPSGDSEEEAVTSVELKGMANVERALSRATSAESAKLESAISFLATTGSASPFIGLFGTVWGIMDTFRGIGAKGTATLAVVAPGISEALIATAAGLAAAIPAVIFYNYFLNRIKSITVEMDSFSAELLNLIERHTVKR